MGRLKTLVDTYLVVGRLHLEDYQYNLVSEVDRLMDKKDVTYDLKQILDKKDAKSLMGYVLVFKKILNMNCMKEDYYRFLDKLHSIQRVRERFFGESTFNLIDYLLNKRFLLDIEAPIDKLIQMLDELKIYDVFFNHNLIYIGNERYIMTDVNSNDYLYTNYIRVDRFNSIEGNVGLLVVKNDDSIEYFRDDVIHSGYDKRIIVESLGIDNIQLLVTRRNIRDIDIIDKGIKF